ncbi:hypothetical protein D3C80_2074450 [compost metagenome]
MEGFQLIDLVLYYIKTIYRMNLAFRVVDPVLSSGVKFGTVGAIASAFVIEFIL